MKYQKPALSVDEQADVLVARGMAGDRELIKSRLQSVNYYRLSGYWFPFRNPDESFQAATTFDTVWDRYVFDRRLRLLVMDAIERIEVALRTQLAYHHAHAYGPFGYATNVASLPKFDAKRHADFVARVEDEANRSREEFVAHFFSAYGDEHSYLPIWMAAEVMSFGTVMSLFIGSSIQVKQKVAVVFAVPHAVLGSWLLMLNAIRNICAHHSRLWNRVLGLKPLMPFANNGPEWHDPLKVTNDRLFAVLTICRHCLKRVAPQSHWADRLRDLFVQFPAIPIADMGFPANWEECPIWKVI